jgi:hypothetical protein
MLLTASVHAHMQLSSFGTPNENGRKKVSGLIILQHATGANPQSRPSSSQQSGETGRKGNNDNNNDNDN